MENFVIISSPTKTMVETQKGTTIPVFLENTKQLMAYLKSTSVENKKKIWKCSQALFEENQKRIERFDFENPMAQALYSYQGLQFQYLDVATINQTALEYLAQHYRIISALYGVLRPTDMISCYRLEMQAKLPMFSAKSVEQFWQSQLADYLTENFDGIIDLTSNEYQKVIYPYLPSEYPYIQICFLSKVNGNYKEKGTFSKMARGLFLRYMAENQVTTLEKVKQFSKMDYHYDEQQSTNNKFVFVKEDLTIRKSSDK